MSESHNGVDHSTAASVSRWIAKAIELAQMPSADPALVLTTAFEGIRLRRHYDAAFGSEHGVETRRNLHRGLLQLEQRSIELMRAVKPFTPTHEAIGTLLADHCQQEANWLSVLLTDAEVGALQRTALLDAFVDDLGWYGGIAATLEGAPSGDGTGRIRLRLGEIAGWLNKSRQDPEPKQSELWARHLDVELRLLGRRVEVELERSLEQKTAEQLWQHRFALSRLRLALQRLLHDSAEVTAAHAASIANAIARIDQRRTEVAECAEKQLREESPTDRGDALQDMTVIAQGEANEITTHVEDVSLAEAVRIIEVGRDDFRELERTAYVLLPTFSRQEPLGKESRKRYRRLRSISSRSADELQDKRLFLRLESIFGRTFVTWLERTVLVLVLVLATLIASEWALDYAVGLTHWQRELFAWADLLICTVFLFEFALKLCFVEGKARYLRRRILVDFFASIPFGFLTFQFTAIQSPAADAPQLLRLLRLVRLKSFVRYLRLAQPFIRVGRLFLFAMRITDGLVRQYAHVFNRNIILFEPGAQEKPRSRYLDQLDELTGLFRRGRKSAAEDLDHAGRVTLADRALEDLEQQVRSVDSLSAPTVLFEEPDQRVIPVEDVVERLIEMTPEQIVDTMGLAFADSVRRWSRLFNVPGIRRLPMIRELLEHREKGPGEVAALAANFLGHLIQGGLNVIYFCADLQATISPPIFLDRLGATLVLATARPAKRLLIFGAALLLLSLFVWPIPMLHPVVAWIDQRLVRPIFVVGLLCLVPLLVGIWLRRVANQAAEFCERVVEAQFAAQTKQIKHDHKEMDLRFLAERVIEPELELRRCDELGGATATSMPVEVNGQPRDLWACDEISQDESLFLLTMKLLYQDYLDGSMLHQSDTKTTTQLLGNLALSNFRLSNLTQGMAIQKRLQALDLSRSAGSVFGGPYLWFNFITRAITQQTARLLIDYNRNAIPLDRLACASREERDAFRQWLARRLGIAAESIELPPPVGRYGDQPRQSAGQRNPRADEFFHTVDFMAIDFLTADEKRDELIRTKYGRQLFALMELDRQANVRKAFRSYPLHDVPLAMRTINPLTMYERYFADGRILFFPFRLAGWMMQYAMQSLFHLHGVIQEIIDPRTMDEPMAIVGDNYDVARRKIHRMRKPVFMESLWLRAQFDIEYAGLPVPKVPLPAPLRSLLEDDLDFIGANRRERTAAQRLRLEHSERLRWIDHWLTALGWEFEDLRSYLKKEYPFLAARAAEVMRAMVTAALLDHDDIYSLASSIEGLQRVFDFARKPDTDLQALPENLPESVHVRRRFWYQSKVRGRKVRDLFSLKCFPTTTSAEQKRIVKYLRKHRAITRGWVRILLSQGGADPIETLSDRWRQVIARTGVWSDQFIALRTIQTLTMLDVYHYCDLVWTLGGYERIEEERFGHELPWQQRSHAMPAASA